MAVPLTSKVTTADFVQYVGNQEAIELSEPDDVNATVINEARLQFHIDLAFQQIDAYDTVACPSGKAFVRRQVAWLQLSITRYLLDTLRRRDDVTEEYNKATELLNMSNSKDICEQFVTAEELIELDISPLTSSVRAAEKLYRYTGQKAQNYRRGAIG